MQCIYHVSYEKLGIESDQDYAEYFLAMVCFGELVSEYQNIEGVEYVASTYGGHFDAFITREGISWLISGVQAKPALKTILQNVVEKSRFPEERFEEIREDYLSEVDTTFQVLRNRFGAEHLEDHVYPTLPLEESMLLATRAGVQAKFDTLRLTSKDYADLTYARGKVYVVPKITAALSHRSQTEPEHLTRLLVFTLSDYFSQEMKNGLRRLLFARTHYPVPIKSLYLSEVSYLYVHVHPEVDEAQVTSIVHEYLQLSRNQKVLLTPMDLVRR